MNATITPLEPITIGTVPVVSYNAYKRQLVEYWAAHNVLDEFGVPMASLPERINAALKLAEMRGVKWCSELEREYTETADDMQGRY